MPLDFDAHSLLHWVELEVKRAAEAAMPFYALVDSTSSGKVALKRIGSEDTPDDQLYARLPGFELAADDTVVCVTIAGEPIVLGKVQNTAPTNYPLAIPLILSGLLSLHGGVDLRLYSDAGTTLEAEIDGATGAASFGDVTGADAVFTSINSPVIEVDAQTSPDTASTTSTTVFSDAMTTAVTLPAGTWTIYALGGLAAKHSANGRIRLAVAVNGTDGTARTPYASSTVFGLKVDDHIETGVAGGGSINVVVRFRSVDAGTTTVENPFVIVIARRTT